MGWSLCPNNVRFWKVQSWLEQVPSACSSSAVELRSPQQPAASCTENYGLPRTGADPSMSPWPQPGASVTTWPGIFPAAVFCGLSLLQSPPCPVFIMTWCRGSSPNLGYLPGGSVISHVSVTHDPFYRMGTAADGKRRHPGASLTSLPVRHSSARGLCPHSFWKKSTLLVSPTPSRSPGP